MSYLTDLIRTHAIMDEILSFFSGLLIAVFPGFSSEVDLSFSGYVEADYV